MSRGDDLRLGDIIEACQELAQVAACDRDEFLSDPIRIRAAERILEIIGEAANVLAEATRLRHPTVNWRDITRLRIVLAHHYHRVDPAQIWTMATIEVPKLEAALTSGEL